MTTFPQGTPADPHLVNDPDFWSPTSLVPTDVQAALDATVKKYSATSTLTGTMTEVHIDVPGHHYALACHNSNDPRAHSPGPLPIWSLAVDEYVVIPGTTDWPTVYAAFTTPEPFRGWSTNEPWGHACLMGFDLATTTMNDIFAHRAVPVVSVVVPGDSAFTRTLELASATISPDQVYFGVAYMPSRVPATDADEAGRFLAGWWLDYQVHVA